MERRLFIILIFLHIYMHMIIISLDGVVWIACKVFKDMETEWQDFCGLKRTKNLV